MNEEQKNFFDYIYPSLSKRIDELEKDRNRLNIKIIEMMEEKKYLINIFNQYKKKIQRIEQFLIRKGLIKLLEED